MRIAGQDILFPTMMVGNYPKPRWFTGQAWSEIPAGRYAADSISFEAFSDAILAIVHDQELAGLDVISDGLMVSGDSPYAAKLYYLTERIDGVRRAREGRGFDPRATEAKDNPSRNKSCDGLPITL